MKLPFSPRRCQAGETTRLLIRPVLAAGAGTIFPRKEGLGGSPVPSEMEPQAGLCHFSEREEGRLPPRLQLRGVRWSVFGPGLPEGRGQTSQLSDGLSTAVCPGTLLGKALNKEPGERQRASPPFQVPSLFLPAISLDAQSRSYLPGSYPLYPQVTLLPQLDANKAAVLQAQHGEGLSLCPLPLAVQLRCANHRTPTPPCSPGHPGVELGPAWVPQGRLVPTGMWLGLASEASC